MAATRLALVCLLAARLAVAQVAYLAVVQEPSGSAPGGAAFPRPPRVAAMRLNGTVDTSVGAGWVATAELIVSPNRFALLRNGTSAHFAGGYADFTGALVNEAGVGYVIRIVSHTFMVETSEFNITVGPAAKVALGQQPGAAYGGSPFSPQPEVQLQDAGGNIVTSHAPINVSVAIVESPHGGGQLSGVAMVAMFKGAARFRGLSINLAGLPYRLRFTSTALSLAQPWVESVNFTVGIGPVRRLAVTTQPAGVYGGSPFQTQPVVALYDAGGNLLVNDNVTRVNVSFARNEYGATLAPEFIRTRLPLYASVVKGSNSVDVTGDPNLYLGNGDLIELAPLQVDDLFQIVDQPVQIRLVLPAADLKLRLQLPWAGASNASATVTKLVHALHARVTRGVATFSRLRLDVAGPEYALRFSVAREIEREERGALSRGGDREERADERPRGDREGRLNVGRGGGDRSDGERFPLARGVDRDERSPIARGGDRDERFPLARGCDRDDDERRRVFVDSAVFPVFVGPPHALRVVTHIGDAWFGGQPFGQQPVISVVDAGGNWLRNVTGMTVTAVLDTSFSNSSNASLIGHTSALVERGIAEFDDLEVTRPGKRYRMIFTTTAGLFDTVDYFDVVYSAEWSVMSSTALPGDNFGSSVDVDGSRMVVGAPSTAFPVLDVQTISTRASTSTFVNEVQIVRTSAVHLDEVQVVATCATSGVIGGGFTMYYAGPDETRLVPYDADADYMKVVIENDLRETGQVQVTRSRNNACATALGAYQWRVTFIDLVGVVKKLAVHGTQLTGTGVTISSTTAVNSTVLGGTFRLGLQGNLTVPLPYDVDMYTLQYAIEAALWVGPLVAVTRDGPDSELGYTWSVTFTSTLSNYDVPTLTANYSSSLTGYGAFLMVVEHIRGTAPIGGTFALMFRGQGPTPPIAYDASASTMVAALQTLPTILIANVTRAGPDAFNGYLWTITFSRVAHLTSYEGFLMDTHDSDLPPLAPVVVPYAWQPVGAAVPDMLTGTGALVKVIYRVGDPTEEPWDPDVMGSAGHGAGAAIVFERTGDRWLQTAVLRASDEADEMHFGWSVAVSGDTIAVGSPGTANYGLYDVQSITCYASAGTFTLSWRLHTTVPIAYTASPAAVKAALESLPTLKRVNVTGPTAACAPGGAVMSVTFIYPADGDLELIIAAAGGDLALGGVAAAANVTVGKTQAGTRLLHGLDAVGGAVGAVYIEQYNASGAIWVQQARLFADDGRVGDQFGWAVALSGDVLMVGAPEERTNGPSAGAVYVFQRFVSGGGAVSWVQLVKLVTVGGSPGDFFGGAVALDGNSGIIGAGGIYPRERNGTAYIAKRNPGDPLANPFMLDQRLETPASTAATTPMAFGTSVAISGDAVVVGGPNAGDGEGGVVGAGFVYDRPDVGTKFTLRQALLPSTALRGDRVGAAVAVAGDTLLVGSQQLLLATGTPRDDVQLITTTAERGATIGNTFSLQWRRKLDRDGTGYVPMSTPPIEKDALAWQVRAAIETALGTGRVRVNRYGPSAEGGYRWFVTFMVPDAGGGALELMTPVSRLTGDGATVTVTSAFAPNMRTRGSAAVYTRVPGAGFGGAWTEQARLAPHAVQAADMYGAPIAMSGGSAVVAARNRDTFVSGRNAGAVFVEDLAFLNLRWSARTGVVSEAAALVHSGLAQCAPACQVARTPALDTGLPLTQVTNVLTADGDRWPTYELAGAPVPPGGAPYVRASATGRVDCLPSSAATKACEWVAATLNNTRKSAFDFAGVSDYAPIGYEITLNASAVAADVVVTITDDTVVETPDESFHLLLYVPGMMPAFGGDLWRTVTVTDDGDGGIGARAYYEKLYSSGAPPAGAAFGSAVAQSNGVVVVGAPFEATGGLAGAGAAYILSQRSGVWSHDAALAAAAPAAQAHFGAGVAIDNTTVVVGAPGAARAYVFVRAPGGGGGAWSLQATLVPTLPGYFALREEHRFGSLGAVAVSGDIAVIGAPGVERAFVFRRTFPGGATWALAVRLTAHDYRELHWLGVLHIFPADFGAAVAVNGTTVVVGAPRANYGPLPEPSTYDAVLALPAYTSFYGTGAVYVYELNATAYAAGRAPDPSPAPVGPNPRITWLAAVAPGSGYNVLADAVGGAWLEVDAIVPSDATAGDRYGAAVALDGSQLIVGSPSNVARPVTSWDFERGDLRGWRTTGAAFAHQPTYGDNTLARPSYSGPLGPGRPQPSGLRGRYFVGTYEHRPANSSDFTAAPADVRSPLWDTVTRSFPIVIAAGTTQGDGPVGTMTSEPFLIAGARISFLVGGGCDVSTEYVELLVDGDSTLRATGACSETMSRVYWNVSRYVGRAAQLRVVDAAVGGPWAHINVDDFRFAWAIGGYTESANAGAAYALRRKAVGSPEICTTILIACEWEPQAKLLAGDKREGVYFGHAVAVDDSTGVAVVGSYLQTYTRPDWAAPGSVSGARIGLFGEEFSMRADGGANSGDRPGRGPHSVWAVNPYLRNVGSSRGGRGSSHIGSMRVGALAVGFDDSSAEAYSYSVGQLEAINYRFNPYAGLDPARGLQDGPVVHTDEVAFGGVDPNTGPDQSLDATGAVYVFLRIPEVRGGNIPAGATLRQLVSPPRWRMDQHSQVTVPAASPGDRFGYAVAVKGFTIVAGTPGDSNAAAAGGALAVVDAEYVQFGFGHGVEYVVAENVTIRRVAIRVHRTGSTARGFYVHYSTRDINAVGVNDSMATACMYTVPFEARHALGCGNYRQTSGDLYFAPVAQSADFTVDIINDHCYEPEPRRFAVQLSVPGGVGIHGPGYTATVRIDDDDVLFGRSEC